jgi:hypothetical protein
VEIFLIALLSFLGLWAFYLLWRIIRLSMPQRQTRPRPTPRPVPRQPPRPPPPPEQPLIPEELTFVIQQTLPKENQIRKTLGVYIPKTADWVIPVLLLTVTRENLAGRILPVIFRVTEAGRNLKEYKFTHTLVFGDNIIFPKDQSLTIKRNRLLPEGKTGKLECFVHEKSIISTEFYICRDAVSNLRNRQLTGSDGELIQGASEVADRLSRPPSLQDLIDGQR